MASRDYAAERYNRRTRALERLAHAEMAQVDALERIAAALELQALTAAAAVSPVHTTSSDRSWTNEYARTLLGHVSNAVRRVSS